MKYSFVIKGEPTGKARPRVTRTVTYTPQKTKDYEAKVREAYKGPDFEDKAIGVFVVASFSIPKSYSKVLKSTLPGQVCTKKPDADNILKIITDALNGVAYQDDKQIAIAGIRKEYSKSGEPGVFVEIKTVEEM